MSKYLKLFETTSQYNEYITSIDVVLPNVSVAKDALTTVYFNPYDYSEDYLTLSALEDGEITITIPSDVNATHATYLSYSKDKSNWVETTIDSTNQTITIPVSAGEDVYLKGKAKQWATGQWWNGSIINSSANIIVSGNIMSLLYGDDFKNKTIFPDNSQYVFKDLFKENTHLVNAENLILPATTLVKYCYYQMFQNCSSLKTAPALPATTLASNCYYRIFHGCSSLKVAPALPATTLASNCYHEMFRGCSSLTTAPELQATTLADWCYYRMFYDCSSLTTAPELPAATLAQNCYREMFYNCSKLNSITMLATDISADSCLRDWVTGVASTGTFVKNSAATWNVTGVNGIPSGWTITTASA